MAHGFEEPKCKSGRPHWLHSLGGNGGVSVNCMVSQEAEQSSQACAPELTSKVFQCPKVFYRPDSAIWLSDHAFGTDTLK